MMTLILSVKHGANGEDTSVGEANPKHLRKSSPLHTKLVMKQQHGGQSTSNTRKVHVSGDTLRQFGMDRTNSRCETHT